MTIDWGTKVINVFKTDMTQLQVTPTEIWRLDVPVFKAALGDLLDDEHGMVYPNIFKHNPEVSVGGVTLAKVIEILEPYTITFEDGQYAVNLIGANNNIGDRTNVNQVSVRSSNSAGLTNVQEIQFASYQGSIALDVANGVSGVTFPIGTHMMPCNNLADAMFIANLRGLESIVVHGNLTLTTGDDVSGRVLKGENTITTMVTVQAIANVTNTQFEDLILVNSTLDGYSYLKHCAVSNVVGFQGYAELCMLSGNISIVGGINTYIVDCKSGCVGIGTTDLPVFDLTGTDQHVAFRNWAGPLKITNSTDPVNTLCIDVTSGASIILDATCTAGLLYVRGIADITNNSGMTVIVVDALSVVGLSEIATLVWDSPKASTKSDIYAAAML